MDHCKEQRAPETEEIVKMLDDFKYGHPHHFALAQDIFMSFVDPEVCHKARPSILEIQQYNMAFSEWALFDLLFDEGESLITLAAHENEEFAEFAGTQFYGRFWLVERHPRKGTCVLRDVYTQRDYKVVSDFIARNKRWKSGTLGCRIARVRGAWEPAGQIFLHDNAYWELLPARDDGEEEDPYDPFAFITNLEQVIGHRGEYRASASIRVA